MDMSHQIVHAHPDQTSIMSRETIVVVDELLVDV